MMIGRYSTGRRLLGEKVFSTWTLAMTCMSCLLLLFIVLGLFIRARPILSTKSLSMLLFSSSWHPLRGEFGFLPFIAGTIWVTCVAVIIAVPLSLLTSLYLSEYAPVGLRRTIRLLVDVLAGIPSVIYGVWGVLVIVPFVRDTVAPVLGRFSSGYSILAGGIVLAVMILPVTVNVMLEVFASVTVETRKASLSLGATRWQTAKLVVVRKAAPGLFAAVVLGLSRAFGETIAVLMIVGNVPSIPTSILDPAYPLPALIANNYGEMLSVPLYDSALLLAALILLSIVIMFSFVSRMILLKLQRSFQ
jgi:phosphate transport system permease protein